ncbi:MAG TPA: flagellin, partial [Vulgatibacter sp.]|nr:flagellin [Vulgatibacter sp.]
AGLFISEKLRSEVNGTNQAIRNANDAISMIQTAEGALNEIHAMLQRMNQLAVQGANGSLSEASRDAIIGEITQLETEYGSIITRTRFAGQQLLNAGTVTFQIGTAQTDTLTVDFKDVAGELTTAMGTTIADLDPTDTTTFGDLIAALTDAGTGAIDVISTQRALLGASQNRLEHTIANLSVAAENLAASESRIRDADIAAETANLSKHTVLMQAGVSVLAQANQLPQIALKLLG